MENIYGLFQLLAHRCNNWWKDILLSWRTESRLARHGTDSPNSASNRCTRHRSIVRSIVERSRQRSQGKFIIIKFDWNHIVLKPTQFVRFTGLGWKRSRCEFHIRSWCCIAVFTHARLGADLPRTSSKCDSTASTTHVQIELDSCSNNLRWIFITIRWSKMDMNFSPNDNWSRYSRHQTIAVNSTTPAAWWLSTNHYCVPSK